MTTDELRALIAECENPDMANSYLRMPDLADLAQDALRFRWLESKTRRVERFYSSMPSGPIIAVEFRALGESLRAAIDAEMGDNR